MITQEELILLLADTESARIERTTSIKDTDKFSQAVCAFANDMPNSSQSGYLVIGVDNEGKPAGLTVTDQLLQNLGALRSDGNILPLPAITVEKAALQGGEVAIVEVQPSDMPPVRYKGQVWIRVGPRKAIASEHEERLLSERRRMTISHFDAFPAAEAKLSDLSTRLFSEYRLLVISPDVINANQRTMKEQLASLRFYDISRNCPTAAGILMFGINPRYFFPGAYIQFLRFPGITMTDLPLDQTEMNGTLPAMADLARGKFLAYNSTGMQRGNNFQDIITDDYPEWAIREFIHNALIHRDYQSNAPIRFYWFEDRIEIQNAGGLFGSVRPDKITTTNDYRNPVLAEGMKSLHYVNRFGYGIQNAQEILKRNGNPPPEISADACTFSVIIRKRQS